jgi:hypothetical protein
MPATFTWNTLEAETEIGWPVHDPNHHRTGEPAESQISTPTIDHVDPDPFVHDSVDVGPVDWPADAEPNVIDSGVDPVPLSAVPADVFVGAVVVRWHTIGVVGAVSADTPSVTFRSAFAWA